MPLSDTASGVDISDGILAATVLEHSPKSYQNILKQDPSNVRASYSAMREYAKTLWRHDGTSGCSAHQTTGPVPMDIDQTRAVSGLAKTARGNTREWARARMPRAKARARKVTRARIRSRYLSLNNSGDTTGTARRGDTKRADCRKHIADGKSKGGAAAASADKDGDVAAVMEVDDDVMGTSEDERQRIGAFGVTSLCAAVGSTGSLLLDSGSDEHLCTPKFADLIPTSLDRSPLKLQDVQQNDLAI